MTAKGELVIVIELGKQMIYFRWRQTFLPVGDTDPNKNINIPKGPKNPEKMPKMPKIPKMPLLIKSQLLQITLLKPVVVAVYD
jgi:hypothetical protein